MVGWVCAVAFLRVCLLRVNASGRAAAVGACAHRVAPDLDSACVNSLVRCVGWGKD